MCYVYIYIYIYVSKIITIRSLYCTAKKKLKPKASKKVLFVFHHFNSAILSKKMCVVLFFRCHNKRTTWASNQTFSEKCWFFGVPEVSVVMYIQINPSRVAAVGSARYCINTNWISKQSTHLQVCRLNQTACLLSRLSWTLSRCAFFWCFHGLRTLPESSLRPLEEIQHSQGYCIFK